MKVTRRLAAAVCAAGLAACATAAAQQGAVTDPGDIWRSGFVQVIGGGAAVLAALPVVYRWFMKPLVIAEMADMDARIKVIEAAHASANDPEKQQLRQALQEREEREIRDGLADLTQKYNELLSAQASQGENVLAQFKEVLSVLSQQTATIAAMQDRLTK